MKREDALELAVELCGGEFEFYNLHINDQIRIIECLMRYQKGSYYSKLAEKHVLLYQDFLDNNKDRDI